MEGTRVAKKEGGGKLPWIITGGVVCALAAAYLGLCAFAMGREAILPNVSVAGINVSNMTQEQAEKKVEDLLSQRGGDVTVNLNYWADGECLIQESLSGADVVVDVEESVRAARQVGHGSFFTAGPRLAGHMLGMSAQLPLVLPENEPAQEELIDRMKRAVADATEDHGYQIEGDRLVMTKGTPIPTVDWDGARTDVGESIQRAFQTLFDTELNKMNSGIDLSVSQNEAADPDFEAIHQEVYTEPKDAALDLENMEITDHAVGVDFDVRDL